MVFDAGLVNPVKRFLWDHCRPLFLAIRRVRKSVRDARDRRIGESRRAVQKDYLGHYGPKVQDGPFRGMCYMCESFGSALLPKLVGSYEAELHPFLEELFSRAEVPTVVDVGCDEGYYAVGLALRLPRASVYAFDINPVAREACRRLCVLNGVQDRVVVEGECTSQWLSEVLRPGSLLVSDCEGCEFSLLDPVLSPALKSAYVLVELHDFEHMELKITPTIVSRFRETHHITLTAVRRRDLSDWPSVRFLSPRQQRLAVYEGRVLGQQWAYLRPKAG